MIPDPKSPDIKVQMREIWVALLNENKNNFQPQIQPLMPTVIQDLLLTSSPTPQAKGVSRPDILASGVLAKF